MTTYKEAGVDIAAGNRLVERIKPLAKATTRRGVMGGLGGFGALFYPGALDYKNPVIVATTDGVGTKLKLAIAMDKHDTIGIDLVAMCVNDLVVQGAEPVFFLDYFATGRLDVGVAESVINGIAEGCKQAGCALVGGETAEMPGVYPSDEYDLAGFAVGMVEMDDILPRDVAEGDVVLGLRSSGVHSNGFSLVHRIIEKFALDHPAPFDAKRTLGKALLEPTRIYVQACRAAHKKGGVKAMAHITGGGLTENLPRVLPDGLGAKIKRYPLPPLFRWLAETGEVTEDEMYRVFNCGIGMVLVVAPESVLSLSEVLVQSGEPVPCELGVIARGSGVMYE